MNESRNTMDKSRNTMDKISILFFADVLYVKGIIDIEEYEDIGAVVEPSELDIIVDKMLRGEYSKRRGEGIIIK